MASLIFCDGFDKYGPTGNQNAVSVMSGDWSVTSTPDIVAPLSSTGYAVLVGASEALNATLPSALTRIAGSFRFQFTGNGNPSFRASNAGTAAFSIVVASATTAIELRTGLIGGALIATGGVVLSGTTHVVSWDITIGAASAYSVYLDGVLLYSGTGNTGNGQTSINGINFIGSTNNLTVDDLAIFNPTDPAYNPSVLTNNVVVETSFPNGDAQKQFTADGNVVWPTGIAANSVYSITATTAAMLANNLHLLKVTPAINCTLNSVSLFPTATSAAAKIRGVVYADSAGTPGALLSSGTEVIGATLGTVLTLPLTSPQALTAGTPIWIGMFADTNITVRQVDATTFLGQRKSATYTSGAPATGSGMTTALPTYSVWGNCTGAASNYASEMLNPPLGTAASQVRSSTAAQEDLYTFPALTTTPSAIYGVAVKGFLAKSDSGARTVSLNMKSASSDSTGSNPGQAMSTTNQWQRSFFDLDPATGLPWTAAGLNAASSGVSVAS